MSAGAVFVTGATGFVGAELLGALARRGFLVHALARPTSRRAFATGLPVVWHAGDLLEPESVSAAVGDFERAARAAGRAPSAIHAAAQLGYKSGGAELAWRVNVEGTRALVAACRAHAIERLLHVSSVVAVGYARDAAAVLDEESSYNGADLRVDYVTTKRAAEDLVLSSAAEFDVVVVNPGAVFGAGPALPNSARFLQRLAARKIPLAPPGSIAAVGVADVAEGILLALERGRRGRRYLLTAENLTHHELLARAAALLGVRAPLFRAPRLAWRLAAALAEPWDRLHPAEDATPQALRMLAAHFRFDSRRARTELGWRPRPVDEVLADTLQALRAQGALPAPVAS